jgi:uncharacterized membrane protein YfcA
MTAGLSMGTIALALICGSFIGSVLGVIGAGGAMLSVPILIYFFHYTPNHASTAALLVVFLAALSGVIPKMRSREVIYREALAISGIGLITNLGGAIVSKHLSDRTILTGFSLVLMIAGSSMLRGPIQGRAEKKMSLFFLILLSLVIGLLTGIFGIGGGFLAIPILVLFFHTPQIKAAGTSLAIICLNTLISLIGHHAIWHSVKWSVPVVMALGAVVVASQASHHASKLPAKQLRIAFAVLLYSIATFQLVKSWILN